MITVVRAGIEPGEGTIVFVENSDGTSAKFDLTEPEYPDLAVFAALCQMLGVEYIIADTDELVGRTYRRIKARNR